MLKINMDVIKRKKCNASARLMGFQISGKFGKSRISRRKNQGKCELEGHSTSPPCGNLVDGLPHDCHMETIAKPARLAPAKNDTTFENFIELSMF